MISIDNIERFVKINNRSKFLLNSIPDYYPGTSKHINFWREQKKYCIEGFWGIDHTEDIDEGYWRYMPGNLYFYVNYCTILHKPEDAPKSAPRQKIKPYLRDVEWEIFYNLTECKGFSGFADDLEFSCDKRLLDKKAKLPEYLIGKKYQTPREYLRKLHKHNYGKPLYNNTLKNLFLLGSRGFGKSYTLSNGEGLHSFLFDGQLEYNNDSKIKPKIQILVGAAESSKSDEFLSKFEESKTNLPGAFEQGDKYVPSPFDKQTTGSLSSKTKNPLRHKYQKKVGGTWKWFGTGTELVHVTYTKENPEAAAGTRPQRMIIEEVGLMDNLLNVIGSNEACQNIGGHKIGFSIYIGTGGNVEKIREPEIVFRNPTDYSCLEFDDVYENSGKIGWFMPYHYCIDRFKDENGNTNLEEAHEWIMSERKKRKSRKTSSHSFDYYMMNWPIVPSEMFLSKKGNIFPVAELKERLIKVKAEQSYISKAIPVNLMYDKTLGIKYTIDNEAKPIYEYKKTISDTNGCPIIYEFPVEINGKVPDDMYILGVDPYKTDDENAGGSMGAIYVMKNYKYATSNYGYSQIVAQYIGRPYGGRNKFNEILEKLAEFYGNSPGGIFFENNVSKGNIKSFFEKKNKLYLLAASPRVVLTNKSKTTFSTSVDYGYSITNQYVKKEAINMLADWLIEEREEGLRNYDLIYDRGLLEELIAFNPDDNFDRVMGMVGCIVGLRERNNEFTYHEEEQKKKAAVTSFFVNNKAVFI